MRNPFTTLSGRFMLTAVLGAAAIMVMTYQSMKMGSATWKPFQVSIAGAFVHWMGLYLPLMVVGVFWKGEPRLIWGMLFKSISAMSAYVIFSYLMVRSLEWIWHIDAMSLRILMIGLLNALTESLGLVVMGYILIQTLAPERAAVRQFLMLLFSVCFILSIVRTYVVLTLTQTLETDQFFAVGFSLNAVLYLAWALPLALYIEKYGREVPVNPPGPAPSVSADDVAAQG